jgi:opacity protein-like surface antigen
METRKALCIMKNSAYRLITASTLLLAAAASARAQYAPYRYSYQPYSYGPFYVTGDLGGNLMQDLHVKNGGSSVTFDPGTRADLSFGWQIFPPLAVEFETGVLWNSLNPVNLNVLPAVQNAGLYQIPFLANAVGRLPLRGGFSAYAGAGAGGVADELDLRQDFGPGFRHHASDTDFTFAYQAMAGFKYAFAPNMEVGVGYKFLGTLDHSWFGGDPNLAVEAGPTYSHSILASFTARF